MGNKNILFLKFSWKLKKAYERTFQELVEEFQLTQNEIDVLLFLYNNAPLDTASDIAKYRAMSKSMISRSVDSLYTKDYLFYERDERDKRCLHLKIRSTAIARVEKLQRAQVDFFASLTKGITSGEYKIAETVLNKMYQNVIGYLDDQKGDS
mgnify:CR=1 FL=1